eukprot:2362241-Alexandrium_andersonii.AAC.1
MAKIQQVRSEVLGLDAQIERATQAKAAIAEPPAEAEAPAAPPAPPGRRQQALEDFDQLYGIVLQVGSDPCYIAEVLERAKKSLRALCEAPAASAPEEVRRDAMELDAAEQGRKRTRLEAAAG